MSATGRAGPTASDSGWASKCTPSCGESALMGSVGEYGWSGAAGMAFWVDPKEQLVGIYMVQASAEDTRFLRNQFRTMVQAAIAD